MNQVTWMVILGAYQSDDFTAWKANLDKRRSSAIFAATLKKVCVSEKDSSPSTSINSLE